MRKVSPHVVHLNDMVSMDALVLALLSRARIVCHAQCDFYHSKVTGFLFRFVDEFVAISQFIKEKLLACGVPAGKIRLVYNAVDVELITMRSRECAVFERLKQNDVKVGLVGCLLPWKGQETFINAVDLIKKTSPEQKISFYIVGSVPGKGNGYADHLERRVSELKLSNDITFLGYVKNVYPVMRRMDIVVHASIKPEPFGLVLIEAMALERLVIASRGGGPNEIISDGFNGILVEPGNPQRLSQAILEALSDEGKRSRLAVQGRKTVKQRFDIETFSEKFKEVYHKGFERESSNQLARRLINNRD